MKIIPPIKAFMKSELPRIIVGAVLFALAILSDALSVPILPIILYIFALIVAGLPVFLGAVKGIMRRDFLDEKFLMCIASIGAMVIGEMTEGVAVMLFFLVGEWFEHRATHKARSSIKSLMQIMPDTARVLSDGEEEEVDAEDVEVGDLILIRPGERVPVDCEIVSGVAEVDTSALTGESAPRPAGIGMLLDSGSVILGASVTARALRPADESRASRILTLVEDASDRKSREESFITSFSRYYTPIVIVLALIMATLPWIVGWLEPRDAVYRALSFLVVSCPCALVISVPMAFFGGIGGGASRGVLYKGGNIFSPTARIDTVVFDKTGTLTSGEFSLVDVVAVGISKERLLTLVASAEHNSNHPIARGIKNAVDKYLPASSLTDIVGKGVIAEIDGVSVAVGNAALMREVGATFSEVNEEGIIYAAVDGEYRGYLKLSDTIKPEALAAIAELRRLGVKRMIILSGDKRESVAAVADALGIKEYYAELLPEEKYSRLEEILENGGGKVAFVGDGINDSPCIARADVGIAMGERGSDSAIEASDVVIMSDKLDRIPTAIRGASRTIRIAKENIVFALGVKLLALLLVSLNIVGMWMAVIADVGVAVLAILNSMRTLARPSR